MMANLAFALIILISHYIFPADIAAPEIVINSHSVDYLFGTYIHFELEVESDTPVEQVVVYIDPAQNIPTIVKELSPADQQEKFMLEQDLKNEPLPGFSTVNYWFEVTNSAGERFQTDQYSFKYIDNRFEWETLSANHFQVHWYEGDISFGQRLLNAVQVGDIRIQNYFQIENDRPLEVYAYASQADMLMTLNHATSDWVIGHANPAIGVIIVTLPEGPEQNWEIDRQIPHEIAHLYLYRKLGESYYDLPRWFNEGLASINEDVINPDYLVLLNHANENDQLIPIADLCNSFPQNASDFVLSYAEAAYFTDFIYSKYGKSGIESLLSAYENGESCETGFQSALGISISELETQWKRAIFSESGLQMDNFPNLLPWIVILAVILLVPVIIIIINSMIKPKETEDYGG